MSSYFSTFPRPTKTYHSKPYPRLNPAQAKFQGAGKTVLITGGATGVGFATAKAFCSTGIARLAIVSRSPEPQLKAKQELQAAYPDVEVLTYAVSVTDYERVNAILCDLNSIDVLILSAAATHDQSVGPLETSVEAIEDVFKVNVLATYNSVQTYLTLPAPSSGGPKNILHVSSVSAQAVLPGQVGYGPSKAASTQMVGHFAALYPPSSSSSSSSLNSPSSGDDRNSSSDVRFFSYHPGVCYTEAVAKTMEEGALEWEDVQLPAWFAVWLAGEESGVLSGRFLWANWDVDELLELREKVEAEEGVLRVGLVM